MKSKLVTSGENRDEGDGEVEKLGYIKIYVYLNIFINIKYKYIKTYKYPYI